MLTCLEAEVSVQILSSLLKASKYNGDLVCQAVEWLGKPSVVAFSVSLAAQQTCFSTKSSHNEGRERRGVFVQPSQPKGKQGQP